MNNRDSFSPIQGRKSGRGALTLLLAGLLLILLGVLIGRVTAPEKSALPADSPSAGGGNVDLSRTEDGAVEAATNFGRVMAGPTNDPAAYQEALVALAAPQWTQEAAKLAANTLDFVRDRYGEGGNLTFAPVRYRLASYSTSEAVVQLWGATIASGPKVRGIEESWVTGTIHLLWIDGHWQVVGQESAAGPTPELLRATDDVSYQTVLEEFEEFQHAQGS